MKPSKDLPIPAKRHRIQTMSSAPLPKWESLSAERQRELIITLAAILIKQLGDCHRMGREGGHE